MNLDLSRDDLMMLAYALQNRVTVLRRLHGGELCRAEIANCERLGRIVDSHIITTRMPDQCGVGKAECEADNGKIES